jgi:hypothetical protein
MTPSFRRASLPTVSPESELASQSSRAFMSTPTFMAAAAIDVARSSCSRNSWRVSVATSSGDVMSRRSAPTETPVGGASAGTVGCAGGRAAASAAEATAATAAAAGAAGSATAVFAVAAATLASTAAAPVVAVVSSGGGGGGGDVEGGTADPAPTHATFTQLATTPASAPVPVPASAKPPASGAPPRPSPVAPAATCCTPGSSRSCSTPDGAGECRPSSKRAEYRRPAGGTRRSGSVSHGCDGSTCARSLTWSFRK